MSARKSDLRIHLIVLVVWLLILAGGFWLIGEVMEDSATQSSPSLSGERVELCADDDRACHEWNDIRESEVQHPTAAQLMAGHGCWTMSQGAPGNVDGIPGGVVVRVDGAEPEYTENATLIAWAMDAYFDGVANGVEPIAFCRGDQ